MDDTNKVEFSVDLKDPAYRMYGKTQIPPFLAQQLIEALKLKSGDTQEIEPREVIFALDEVQSYMENLRGIAALAFKEKKKVKLGPTKELPKNTLEVPPEETEDLLIELLKYLESYVDVVQPLISKLKTLESSIAKYDRATDPSLKHTALTAINSLYLVEQTLRSTCQETQEATQNLVHAQKAVHHIHLLLKSKDKP